MTTTLEVTLYQYDELPTEKAKEKARQWYSEANDLSYLWEDIKRDANTVHLKIISLDQHRANKGEFITSAPECAETILNEHGQNCETYKTAKAYLAELAELGDRPSDSWQEGSDVDEPNDSYWEDAREDLDKKFLQSLLSDYFYMLQRNEEYASSEESVSDNILANEYTFLENGTRFG